MSMCLNPQNIFEKTWCWHTTDLISVKDGYRVPVSGQLWCTPAVLSLEMCCGAGGTSWLTGGEDKQARWFSKLISIKHAPIQNTCYSEIGLITFARHCWRWTWWWLGQPGDEMLWEGRTPSKNLPIKQMRGWWYLVSTEKALLSKRGQDFTLCVHSVDTGPDSKGHSDLHSVTFCL